MQIAFLLYNPVNLLQDNKIQFLASFNFLNKEVWRLPYNPTKRGRFAELRTPNYTLRRTGLLDNLAKFYGISIDQIVHMDSQVVPQEITIEDKTTSEQVRLIAELDEKDKSIIFGLIETMLTKKKFKDFINKNVAML